MARLPQVTARELIRFLKSQGFAEDRQSGSHLTLWHEARKVSVTVPVHTGSDLGFDPDEEEKFSLRPGDLLVCEGGEPGRAAVWHGEINPCFYQKALHRLRPLRDAVDPAFVMYRLWLGAMSQEFGGSHAKTTIAHLPAVRLAQLSIAVPALDVQQQIVADLRAALASVEQARTAAEVRLETVSRLIPAQLRVAFRGLTPLATDGQRGGAPEGWAWRRLTTVARLESGHTPSRHRPDWWDGAIPWLSLTDIRDLDGRVAHETREHTNAAGIANSAARILPAGTVVLSRTASVGFVTTMGREMCTSQDFVNWVCGPELDPHFLAYLLRASRRYIRSLSSGAIHQTVYMPTVEAFSVCMPSLEEQGRISMVLDERIAAAELLRVSAEAELASLNRLPAAILRAAFTAEL